MEILKKRKDSFHSIGIGLFLLIVICSDIFVNRLSLISCSAAVFALYYFRVVKIQNQMRIISKGNYRSPSMIDIIDSFLIIELIVVSWGFYNLFSFFFCRKDVLVFPDCLFLSFLLSSLLFLVLIVFQHVMISYFFPFCVSHGFFMFSVLPRIVAATRTFFVSFIWIDALKTLPYTFISVLVAVYAIIKLVFFLSWMFDFFAILHSKDFPPEFATVRDKRPFTCPVCLENVHFYITLKCTHQFCLRCFCKWGSIHLNCPVCRNQFSSWIHQVEFDAYLSLPFVIF